MDLGYLPRRTTIGDAAGRLGSACFKVKDQKMNKIAFVLSLALSVSIVVAGANAGTGKATTLMDKELPDFPGKDGMVELVDFAPGEVSQPHRHNADLFVFVLEGTIVTQVEGEAPKNLKAGDVFYKNLPRMFIL